MSCLMEHLSVRICQARAHREREQQLPVAIFDVRDVNVLFMWDLLYSPLALLIFDYYKGMERGDLNERGYKTSFPFRGTNGESASQEWLFARPSRGRTYRRGYQVKSLERLFLSVVR